MKPAPKPRGKPFVKGQSGNPGGRPKSFSEAVREVCDELKLARVALDIALGEQFTASNMFGKDIKVRPKIAERLEALKFLRDTGWGRPAVAVTVSGPGGGPLRFDLSGMTDEELASIETIYRTAAARRGAGGAGET